MDDEPNISNKRRRRSSLFVERRSSIVLDEEVQLSSNEPNCLAATASGNINAGDIQNYISNTKQCYKSWRLHQKEVKSKLEAARNAKPLQIDEKALAECLTPEDRSFLEEAKEFIDKKSQLAVDISSAGTALAALVDEYESNKQLMGVIYDQLSALHQATVVTAIEDHKRTFEKKFAAATERPTSADASPILVNE